MQRSYCLHTMDNRPIDKLDSILYELAVADHLRGLQTMYRDTHDEQILGQEFRIPLWNLKSIKPVSDLKDLQVKVKDLLYKIIEGRTRSVVLLRLCYGDQSIPIVRGLVDLANSFALQGMWNQAEEHITSAWSKLIQIEDNKQQLDNFSNQSNDFRIALAAAQRVRTSHNVIRRHVIKNYGQVRKTLIKEIIDELASISSNPSEDYPGMHSIAKLAMSLNDFFTQSRSKLPLKQLVSNSSYFPDSNRVNATKNKPQEEEVRSWGELIEYFRTKCEVMRSWQICFEKAILPQNKACLALPFRICDHEMRQFANPIQLSSILLNFASVGKLISGSNIIKMLNQTRAEVPLVVNHSNGGPTMKNQQVASFELPITWEEYLCIYITECLSIHALSEQFSVVKMQVLALKGICSINSNQISVAEEVFTKSLRELEMNGWEMEPLACELYNAIAQMMITKYQDWLRNKKLRYRAEAEAWLQETEGKKALKIQFKQTKKQYDYTSQVISKGELEYLARDALLKKKMKELFNSNEENDSMRKSLEAAYRYLVRSLEILEGLYGGFHPIVATACLAVASVQNMVADYTDTREWLLKSLRIMDKCVPLPIRAITFTQTQLSQVLVKLGHDEEARKVLTKAMQFHLENAKIGVASYRVAPRREEMEGGRGGDGDGGEEEDRVPETARSKQTQAKADNSPSAYNLVLPIILKNTPLNDEIITATSLVNQVIKMCVKVGDSWDAAAYAEELAKLLEAAYGWDSLEAAEAFKQAGSKCAAVKDWSRANKLYFSSLQAHLALFPKTDAKLISIQKLYEQSKLKRVEANTNYRIESENPKESSVPETSAQPPQLAKEEQSKAIIKESDGQKLVNSLLGLKPPDEHRHNLPQSDAAVDPFAPISGRISPLSDDGGDIDWDD